MKKVVFFGFMACLLMVAGCGGGDPANKGYGNLATATYTNTPPPTFKAVVLFPDYCYNGPSENYPRSYLAIIPANTTVDVLGKIDTPGAGNTIDWFMIEEESIGRCWINANTLNYSNVDLKSLITFTTAYTISESVCYTGPGEGYTLQTQIPSGLRIVIYAKYNLNADWVLVIPRDSTNQCWVARYSLSGFDPTTLQDEPAPALIAMIATTTPQTNITLTPTPQINITAAYSPIEIRWRVLSYDCSSNGKATGALISLDVSGGTYPNYIYYPNVPVYAVPGQAVSITVYSTTFDGKPSNSIQFTVPNASDTSVFKCDKPGSNPGPTAPPSPPTSIPPTSIPPTSPPKPTATLCWPPGHCR